MLTARSEPASHLDSGGLEGRAIRLRSVSPNDYRFIRDLETDAHNLVRYRHRGVTISPEAHLQNLWQGVLAQFIIESKIDGQPLGLAAAFGADFRNGHCSIATVTRSDLAESPPLLEGTRLFVNYLFEVFPLHKLCASVIDFNWPQFASGAGRMFSVEGVLRDHEWHAGRYWDVHVLAIHRDRWQDYYSTPAPARLGVNGPRTFDRFCEDLGTTFGWDWSSLRPQTRLVEDLSCDSVTMVELIALLDDVAGSEINESAFAQVTTLGELWQLYSHLAHHDGE